MEIDAAERGETVEFSGETFEGDTISTESLDGPTLVNFWYAACAPCRVEAPDLAELSQKYADDVTFLGVNVRDAAVSAASRALPPNNGQSSVYFSAWACTTTPSHSFSHHDPSNDPSSC